MYVLVNIDILDVSMPSINGFITAFWTTSSPCSVIAGEEADSTDKDDVDRVDAITQSLPSSDIGLSASKSQGTL